MWFLVSFNVVRRSLPPVERKGIILFLAMVATAFAQHATSNFIIVNAGETRIETDAIDGEVNLFKGGAGTLVLSAVNGYDGYTILSAGILQLGGDDRINELSRVVASDGTTFDLNDFDQTLQQIEFASGSTLDLGAGTLTLTPVDTTLEVNGSVIGSGSIVHDGAWTVNLNGNNTFSGGVTTASSGTLELNHNNAAGTGLITLGGGRLRLTDGVTTSNDAVLEAHNRLDVNSGTATFAGVVSESGGSYTLTKDGDGTLIVSGASTYTGGTNISGGILQLANDDRLSSTGRVYVNDGARFDLDGYDQTVAELDVTSTSLLDLGAGNLTITGGSGVTSAIDGNVVGSGDLVASGAGEVHLSHTSNNSTFSGDVVVNSGATVRIDASNAAGSGDVVLNGGRLALDYDGSFANDIVLADDGTVQFDTDEFTFYSPVSETGGSQTLTLISVGTIWASTTMSHTGGTIVEQGALEVSNDDTFHSDSSFTLANDAAFLLNGYDQVFKTVTTSADSSLNLGFLGDLTLSDGGGSTSILDGTVSGASANLTVTNGAFLQLNGQNSFGGSTAVTDGATLHLGHDSALGSSTTSITDSTLSIGDGINNGGAVTFNAGSIVEIAADATGTQSGTIGGSGGFAKTGAGTLVLAGTNNLTGDMTLQEGVLTTGSASPLGSAAIVFDGGLFTPSASFTASNNLVTSDGGGGIEVGDGLALTASGVLSGGDATTFTKSGAGTLVLTGDNTISGDIALAAGTLSVSSANQLGVSGGGTLFDEPGNLVFSGGTLAVTDSFTTDKEIHVEAGGATFEIAAGETFNHNSRIEGAGALNLTGEGTFDINTPIYFSHTGDINVQNGTLSVSTSLGQISIPRHITVTGDGHFGFEGTASLYMGELDVAATASVDINHNGHFDLQTNADSVSVIDGVISSSGSGTGTFLVFGGSGTVELNGANTFSNGTHTAIANSVTAVLGHDQALGSSANNVRLTGGSLRFVDGVTIANDLTLYRNTTLEVSSGSSTFAGDLAQAATLGMEKTGGGTLIVSGNLTYTGGTTVSAGTLQLGAADALGSGEYLTIANGGTFDFNDYSQRLTDLDVASGGVVNLGSGSGSHTVNFTVDSGRTAVIDGMLTGTLNNALEIDGEGTVQLNGANTFDAAQLTMEDSVSVTLGHAQALGHASNTLVMKSGTLNLGGQDILQGINLEDGLLTGVGSIARFSTNGGTIAPGDSPGLMTFESNVTLDSDTLVCMELAGYARGTQYDAINVTGTLTQAGTLTVTLIDDFTPSADDSFQLFSATSIGGSFATTNLPTLAEGLSWNTDNLATTGTISVLSAVPEPATFATLLGLLALGFTAIRRRR